MASISDSPSEVQRSGCTYTRRRASSSCIRAWGRSSNSRHCSGSRCSARGQAGHPHAEHIERRGRGETGQQVGAGRPAPAHRVVDHHRGAGDVPGPAGAGIRDAVFHHVHRRPPAVPVHGVEPGHVHDGHARARPPSGAWCSPRARAARRAPGRRPGRSWPGSAPARRAARASSSGRWATSTLTCSLRSCSRRDLDDVGRPVPGPGAAQTERSAVRAAPGSGTRGCPGRTRSSRTRADAR